MIRGALRGVQLMVTDDGGTHRPRKPGPRRTPWPVSRGHGIYWSQRDTAGQRDSFYCTQMVSTLKHATGEGSICTDPYSMKETWTSRGFLWCCRVGSSGSSATSWGSRSTGPWSAWSSERISLALARTESTENQPPSRRSSLKIFIIVQSLQLFRINRGEACSMGESLTDGIIQDDAGPVSWSELCFSDVGD